MQDVRTGRMRPLPSDGPRLRRKRVASAMSLGLREHDKAETRRSHGRKPWGPAITIVREYLCNSRLKML